jgi:hypothetical protein
MAILIIIRLNLNIVSSAALCGTPADGRAKMRRRIFQATAAVLLVAQGACTSVRVVTPGFVASESPNEIWVTRSTGAELQLFAPRVEGDSIFGLVPPNEEISVPIGSLTQVKARRVDGTKTLLFGLGVATVAGVLGYFAFKNDGRDTNCFTPPGQLIPVCSPN